MRTPVLIGTVLSWLLFTTSAAAADLTLTMTDGRVTVVAEKATLRQILAEWARIGATTIVNLERISDSPMTVELTNVPERDALDILLRSVSYIAAPRPAPAANQSRFDRIILVIASAAPLRQTAVLPAATGTQPQTYTPGASQAGEPVSQAAAQRELGRIGDVIDRGPTADPFSLSIPPPPVIFNPGAASNGQASPSTPAAVVPGNTVTSSLGSAAPGVVIRPPPPTPAVPAVPFPIQRSPSESPDPAGTDQQPRRQ